MVAPASEALTAWGNVASFGAELAEGKVDEVEDPEANEDVEDAPAEEVDDGAGLYLYISKRLGPPQLSVASPMHFMLQVEDPADVASGFTVLPAQHSREYSIPKLRYPFDIAQSAHFLTVMSSEA